METAALLEDLSTRGAVIKADGALLRVVPPPEGLTAQDRVALRAYKAELLAILAGPTAPALLPAPACGGPQNPNNAAAHACVDPINPINAAAPANPHAANPATDISRRDTTSAGAVAPGAAVWAWAGDAWQAARVVDVWREDDPGCITAADVMGHVLVQLEGAAVETLLPPACVAPMEAE